MAGTPVKILVPGNHLMAGLLGQRDELLRLIEGAFPDVRIAVRGNEVTVEAAAPTPAPTPSGWPPSSTS